MNFLDKQNAIEIMNTLGANRTPFLFITSFDTAKNIVIPLSEINPLEIAFDFNQSHSNLAAFKTAYQFNAEESMMIPLAWQRFPIGFKDYKVAFNQLMAHLKSGNIQLANLTFPTRIACNLTLPEIFARTQAKYRLFLQDHFCAFSPETFVTIKAGIIATYPMKGTINAGIENAEKVLLDNPKEIDEHETVAKEALRDISLVADDAHISRFRYVDRVERGDGAILQTSSVIEGSLPENFHESLGNLLYTLLPAGSITGSPRETAIDILSDIETYDRGFYSGVAGIFDGENLDSAVLIRYLEKSHSSEESLEVSSEESHSNSHSNDEADIIADTNTDTTSIPFTPMAFTALSDEDILFRYTFKSGGGITAMSNAESEYDELIEKIYLPIC